jgi:hypothetical protein
LCFANSDANDSYIGQLNDNTYNDNGAAIDSYFWTKEFSGYPGDENYHKDFRECRLLYENSGAWFMGFGYRVNSDSGSGILNQIDLNPGTFAWGTLVWGTDPWGGGYTDTEETQYLGNASGKRIQFKFTNQNEVDRKFKVLGLNYSYNKKGTR